MQSKAVCVILCIYIILRIHINSISMPNLAHTLLNFLHSKENYCCILQKIKIIFEDKYVRNKHHYLIHYTVQ